jgi:hypothetical protein
VNNTEKAKQYETEKLLEDMKKFLSYDPCSGNVVFTDTRYGAKEVGQVAGYVDRGYVRIYHKRRQFMAHRVAWALYHNKWPEHTIDHINRDGTDNRIINLRDVPQVVNNNNKAKTYKKRVDNHKRIG